MSEAYRLVGTPRFGGILVVSDHASNRVPDDIDLGISPDLLDQHIAVDIGVGAIGELMAQRPGFAAFQGNVSRLVCDFNRDEHLPTVVPDTSDGHAIPGNAISHEARLARIEHHWRPYHARIAAQITAQKPSLLISLHSFTPQLETRPEEARPWEVGILYNRDDRAARQAIPALEAAGVIVGDQLPYSGKLLNATMNHHGEGNGIAYLGIEMRQDLIGDAAGVARWCAVLAPVIAGLAL